MDSGSEARSAPRRLVCTIHQLSHCCANRVLLLVAAISRMCRTSPNLALLCRNRVLLDLLELRLRHRLLGLMSRTLPGHFGYKLDEPFRRTEQGIPGKDNK